MREITQYRFFGKVVYHPVLKALAVGVTIILLGVCLLLSPVLVPAHFLLRRSGRNGFYFNGKISVDKESFQQYYELIPPGSFFHGRGIN